MVNKILKVLIACEESQRVCTEFRKLGHEAYSCDIQMTSGEHPEWHILGDALPLINGNCEFCTLDNEKHIINGKWDLLIAHPPCTHLAISGQRWFKEGRKPWHLQEEAAEFFMKFINADCDHIAVENPVSVMATKYRKSDQCINPYQFGHPEQKRTCLWLKNLPKLIETNNVKEEMMKLPKKKRSRICYEMHDSKERSKTYLGIAEAMAKQWSEAILNK